MARDDLRVPAGGGPSEPKPKGKKKKGGDKEELPGDPFKDGDKVPGDPGPSGDGRGGGSGGGGFQPTLLPSRFRGQDAYLQQITDLYVQIWGTAPPPGYVEGMMKRGLNLYEVLDRERRKPAFRFTRFYRDSQFRVNRAIADWFGGS